MIQFSFLVSTKARCQFINITRRISAGLVERKVADGLCHVFVPHTTAGITINESADPDVVGDVIESLDGLVPLRAGYRHAEGNSAAHIKTLLTGSSVSIPIVGQHLQLGTWQGVFFCEYDGPRERKVQVSVIAP